jgi:polysaccharide pyruvyl transferase WcaK-like protein
VPQRAGQTLQLLHVDNFDAVGPEVYQRMVEISQTFAHETARTYRQTNNLIPAGHNGALARTLERYVSADLVLTSRLHGCILALATGRQVLAVAADRKVDSFMAAIGLSEWVYPPSAVESLPDTLATLSRQSLPIKRIESEREQNRRLASDISAMLAFEPSVSPAP